MSVKGGGSRSVLSNAASSADFSCVQGAHNRRFRALTVHYADGPSRRFFRGARLLGGGDLLSRL